MTNDDAKRRIEDLKRSINRHRYLYHVLDKPELSDAALDSLKAELGKLEEEYPEFITPDSPTQRVGGEPSPQFRKARHSRPMLSLGDAHTEEDVREWFTRLTKYLKRDIPETFYCELKIDGLAIELIYENGIFLEGSTRGDGLVGEDITQNLKTIEAIPLSLETSVETAIPKRLVVRGEVYLTVGELSRINALLTQEGKPPYANTRNLAAGSLRQLDPAVTAERRLDVIAYDIVEGFDAQHHHEEHEELKRLGFKISHESKLVHSLSEAITFRNFWEERRESLPFEIDGIVIILDDNALFREAGDVGKAPRAALAYKFSAREAPSVVESLSVGVGRTGALTPVAKLRPVSLGGITITHATLHNVDEIERLGLKIGDTVVVTRAGDVIPKVTSVLTDLRTGKEKTFHMPKRCPADGSQIIRDGVAHRCSNKLCGARVREAICHFVSRGAFRIEGLGQKIIDGFLDEGLISDAADLFTLSAGDIALLSRFGEKSAENITEEIKKKRKITLPRFLYAIGILHVGEETSALLAGQLSGKAVSTPSRLGAVMRAFSQKELEEIPDVGPKVSKSIYEWFHDQRNQTFLLRLTRAGIRIEHMETSRSGRNLSGLTFVLTGALARMGREDAKEKIRSLGGTTSESVSKKTDYVVLGENPGEKKERAKALGVKTLDEKAFLKMIE